MRWPALCFLHITCLGALSRSTASFLVSDLWLVRPLCPRPRVPDLPCLSCQPWERERRTDGRTRGPAAATPSLPALVLPFRTALTRNPRLQGALPSEAPEEGCPALQSGPMQEHLLTSTGPRCLGTIEAEARTHYHKQPLRLTRFASKRSRNEPGRGADPVQSSADTLLLTNSPDQEPELKFQRMSGVAPIARPSRSRGTSATRRLGSRRAKASGAGGGGAVTSPF